MKNYLTELVLCTIVAAACTFISYILGLEKSWQSAANTFGVAFLAMFVVGLFLKNKKSSNKSE
jgi:hypothetical protein